MAGIGFELKKMFKKRGILAILKAYGYAGIVCTGPMILGVVLLLSVRIIAQIAGSSEAEMELLNSIVTVTLLSSLAISGAFSLVTTRYTADALYEEKNYKIMPAFWGSTTVMLLIGCILFGILLAFSGVPTSYRCCAYVLFGELLLVWNEINFLTAIKDYQSVLLVFALAVVLGLLAGAALTFLYSDIIFDMFFAVAFSYGIMAIWYYYLLVKYFPEGGISSMDFLRSIDKYKELFFTGLLLPLGTYGHIVIMWFSPMHKHLEGIFYGTPVYDVPALVAFLSTLITTISFVTSVEVNFYPKYRNYFSLYNDKGSYADIKQAEREMKSTLSQELAYCFTKQYFTTVIFIIGGSIVLLYLPLGMTEDMLGIYRVLCAGYAFYAVGNATMLIQLYFSDNKGALISTACFAFVSCFGTGLFASHDIKLFGIGFLVGSMVYTFVALGLLFHLLRHIMYYVLATQPIIAKQNVGILTRISDYFVKRYKEKNSIQVKNLEAAEAEKE